MVDLSYYQCLTFMLSTDNMTQVPRCISILSNGFTNELSNNLKFSDLETNKTYDGFLYNKEDRLICPLIIFNCGQVQSTNESIE